MTTLSSDTLAAAAAHCFIDARTHHTWTDEPVGDAVLRRLYELVSLGPTSMNCQPMRLQFVRSAEAKERLLACVGPGNVDKTRTAPVTAIVGMDMAFYEQLPRTFPHKAGAREVFAGKDELVAATAMRNSSLQGGYLIVAARLLGLDCGAMSGFDAAAVDRAFWAGTTVRTNFLCNLGHGVPGSLLPRQPRLAFDEACRVV
jgi:3-hydroxypropanoate dehydrogenase